MLLDETARGYWLEWLERKGTTVETVLCELTLTQATLWRKYYLFFLFYNCDQEDREIFKNRLRYYLPDKR